MVEKLKPCPFCGGEARHYDKWSNWTHSDAVICTECGAVMVHSMRETAEERWNKRTQASCKRIYHPNRSEASGPSLTCSECGYGATDGRWSYCPKCGAKYENTRNEAFDDEMYWA